MSAAHDLAKAGWPVFPTRAKKPLTPNGFKGATTDATTISGWWEQFPEAQIAIAIPQGKLVVDIDTTDATHPADGFATLAKLEKKHGALPPTLTSVSGRGGEHRWYTLPPDAPPLIQRDIGPGIQTRCAGKGYVVAPPSIHHETGKPYTWRVAPIAEAPAWLVEFLTERTSNGVTLNGAASWPAPTTEGLIAARGWLAKAAPSVEKANGSGALMKAAGVLVRGFALGPELGSQLLREYNETAQPPWAELEIGRAIESAATSTREPAVGSMLVDTDLLAALRPKAPTGPIITIGASDIFSPLPQVNYLVHGLGIAPGAPTLIAGYGYSGKTVATQQLAVDLVRPDHAGEWMNKRPVWAKFLGGKRARVLHIDYENGKNLTCRRYQRLVKAAGFDWRELEGWLRLVSLPSIYLNTHAGFEAILGLCENVDLVIVDSFRASCPGLEENSSDAREPLDALNRVSEKQGCASIVIHHARKPSQDKPGGAKMSIRGSGAIFDGADNVLVFEGDKGKPTRVTHEKERNSGITCDDFELIVEDADGGGLRVRANDILVKTPAERSNADLQADVEKIRAWCEGNVFFKNRDQISRGVGISAQRASAAMGAMQTTGELTFSGSHRDRSYHLSGKGPAT